MRHAISQTPRARAPSVPERGGAATVMARTPRSRLRRADELDAWATTQYGGRDERPDGEREGTSERRPRGADRRRGAGLRGAVLRRSDGSGPALGRARRVGAGARGGRCGG